MIMSPILIYVVAFYVKTIYSLKSDSVETFGLITERIVGNYTEPRMFEGNMSSTKLNRTTLVLNVYVIHKLRIKPGDMMVKIVLYKFLSNTYRLTSVQFNFDFCQLNNRNSKHAVEGLWKNSNMPACPIPTGAYYIRNGLVNIELSSYVVTIPANFVGHWKVQATFIMRNKVVLVIDIFWKVFRKAIW